MTLKQLTTTQAARVLGVSSRRVVQMANEGALVFEWTPLGRLYDAAELERVAKERADRKAAALAGGGR